MTTFQSEDPSESKALIKSFCKEYGVSEDTTLLSGENGDLRHLEFFTAAEEVLGNKNRILRFKHLSGEYATASAQALWYACKLLHPNKVPPHFIKREGNSNKHSILIYNCYQGLQHSLVLLAK